jgi:ABC-2 type transport system ATP-binding protein
MDEAQHLADRVIVIARGEIVAEGPPETIAGRASGATRIAFSVPTAFASSIPLAARRHDNGSVAIESNDPTGDLHRLTTWALEAGVALEGLTVTRPSLEDVYLQLVAEGDDDR